MARSTSGAKTRKKNKRRKKANKQKGERVWLGGRGRLPVSVEENGVVHEVDWLLLLESPSGLIVGSAVVPSAESNGCLGRLLLESIAAPMIGAPRKPKRIVVASEGLAAGVRQELVDRIPIEVCATPELDLMAAALAASLGEGDGERHYLRDDIDASLIESFFEGANAFARIEPWRVVGEEDVLRLDVPDLDLEGAAVLVAGAMVEAHGFIVFADMQDCMAFVFGEDEANDDVAFGTNGEPCLVMNFLPRRELSAAMQSEIDEHGWPTTPAGSCPVIVRPTSDSSEILPTRRDYRLATVVASALAHFVREHAAAFGEMMPGLIQDSTVDVSGVRVELAYSLEALEEEHAKGAAGADARPGVRLSVKVYEAVRELDLLSPRARDFLASATPTSDGDGWRLDGGDDLGHLRELLSAAADRRIGGAAVAEAAATLRMDPIVEFNDGDAAANARALRTLLRATEKAARMARRDGPKANGRTRRTRAPDRSIYQLKVTLREIRPPVWRRLEVGSGITLARLHGVIQGAMGWTDSHLHHFECDDQRFGIPSDDDWANVQSEQRVRLGELLRRPKDELEYVYDFGDNWRHRVVLEKILPAPAGKRAPAPRCTGGKRDCPPEDCGGAWAYQNPDDFEAPDR